jgi:hypothetical protein
MFFAIIFIISTKVAYTIGIFDQNRNDIKDTSLTGINYES